MAILWLRVAVEQDEVAARPENGNNYWAIIGNHHIKFSCLTLAIFPSDMTENTNSFLAAINRRVFQQ
jgi:hypothetical protein